MAKNILDKVSGGYSRTGSIVEEDKQVERVITQKSAPIKISGSVQGKAIVAEGLGNENAKTADYLPGYLADAIDGNYGNDWES